MRRLPRLFARRVDGGDHFRHSAVCVVERRINVRNAGGIRGREDRERVHVREVEHDVHLVASEQLPVGPVVRPPQPVAHELVAEPAVFEEPVLEDVLALVE